MRKKLFDKFYERFKPRQAYEEFRETIKQVEKLKPKKIIEVGIYKGGTLAFWYHLLPEDDELLIGIEPFLDPSVPQMFPQDYKNLVLMPLRSKSAAKRLESRTNNDFDFIFIDGDHMLMEEDYILYFPFLREGGMMAIHDFKGSMGRPTYYRIEEDGWDRFYNFGPDKEAWATAYIWKSKTGRKEQRGNPPRWVK